MELDTNTDRLVVGDDYTVTRSIDTVVDDAVEEAWLTLKETEFDTNPVVQKHIDVNDSDGPIVEDSSGQTILVFELTAAETTTLSAYTRYDYDIQVKYASGKLKTKERGNLTPVGEVTTEE